ncbi:MAG: hypothetical protein F6K11_34590 [Leptolyngbya sp. SIO3F4]|nr:hypothetical protein [Leptolyngbya sp. SIO3F4]
MIYLPQQQFTAITTVAPQHRTSARKKTKRLNLVITMLISFVGTLTLSWGISLGEVIKFLVRDAINLHYLGFLVGLGISISIAVALSAVIQLFSALWTWLYKRYRYSRSTTINPPHSTQHQLTIYDYLDEVNFQIWSIIWNTIRGLGLSLAFVLVVLIIVR